MNSFKYKCRSLQKLPATPTGSQHQVSTILYICPEREFAVAILSNLESVKLFELARTMCRLVSQDWTTSKKSFQTQTSIGPPLTYAGH